MTSPRLFIGGLKRDVSKEEMTEEFKEFGELTDTWIAYDPPGSILSYTLKTNCFTSESKYFGRSDDLINYYINILFIN